MKNAAGLYNLMRDLGGAIGLAGGDRHDHERQAAFPLEPADRGHKPARAVVQQFLEAQTSRFDALIPGDPRHAAIKLLANLTQREALVLTYNDLLLLLGALFVFGLMLLPLVRRPRSFFAH
jgi:DHA2 family multidrug resistance protein